MFTSLHFICSKLQMTMPANFIQNQLMVLNKLKFFFGETFNKYNIILYVPLFNTQNFVTSEYIV